ncbi:peroxiredoxin [Streptomyces sp. NPDC056512]|uniref:peroxiredoxin n=1 Tax=Streptomyces sp. NPDC056512 TaxID=3345846 RepID=UPI0036CC14BD
MQGGAGVKQAVRGNDELAVLLARVGEEDAGESGLKDVTSPAFVLHEDDDVVAAAGYQAWPQSVAHLSVLVAPGHRGEGWRRLWRLLSIHTSVPADLPVPEDDGAAAHLPGTKVPHLELQDTDGTTVRLDALGAGRTVIYIYPLTGRPGTDLPDGWDSIPGARGCTPEACAFRDHYQDLLAAGAEGVFGLSSQETDYQREVVERLHLPFQMLSDPAHSLAQELCLPTFETSGLTLYKRLTLIIRDGVVEHVFYPIFPPHEHADQVLSWLGDNPL